MYSASVYYYYFVFQGEPRIRISALDSTIEEQNRGSELMVSPLKDGDEIFL